MFRLTKILPRVAFRSIPKTPLRSISAGWKKQPSKQMEELKSVFKGPGRLICIVPEDDHTRVDILDDSKIQTNVGFTIDSVFFAKKRLERFLPRFHKFVELVEKDMVANMTTGEMKLFNVEIESDNQEIVEAQNFVDEFENALVQSKQQAENVTSMYASFYNYIVYDKNIQKTRDKMFSNDVSWCTSDARRQHLIDMKAFITALNDILYEIIIAQKGFYQAWDKLQQTYFYLMPYVDSAFSDYMEILKMIKYNKSISQIATIHKWIKKDLQTIEKILNNFDSISNGDPDTFYITQRFGYYIDKCSQVPEL
jgi:hypothetical protein